MINVEFAIFDLNDEERFVSQQDRDVAKSGVYV